MSRPLSPSTADSPRIPRPHPLQGGWGNLRRVGEAKCSPSRRRWAALHLIHPIRKLVLKPPGPGTKDHAHAVRPLLALRGRAAGPLDRCSAPLGADASALSRLRPPASDDPWRPLLENRIIFLEGVINDGTANLLVMKFLSSSTRTARRASVLHQQPRRERHQHAGDLRHHAVHRVPDRHLLHWHGGLGRGGPAGRGSQG